MPYCPECSASVPDGAASCPTCGAELVATPADGAEQEPSPASDLELVTADLRHSLAPQYEYLRVLGTGGMGAVYLLREPALKRLVAVKVLAPWLAADARARTRFEREARAAAALSHPNVVRVYAEGETSGLRLPYIVMQYVEGPTLSEWMEQHRPASEREARRIIGEVASGLAAAHARQLVHRDVKPSNVLVEHDTGRAYVVDFGVSAALATSPSEEATRLTATGTVTGTPVYMSPEQASGETVTPKSDVYSLGIIAYELLVGELLRLPDGRSCLQTMLARLPQHRNWQFAFLEAFHTHFERPLDVEKWWALSLTQANGRFAGQAWSLAESAVLPSVEKATAAIGVSWPVKTESSLPVAASQRRTVLSRLPESTLAPSGEKATQVTSSLCPCQTAGNPAGAGAEAAARAGMRTATTGQMLMRTSLPSRMRRPRLYHFASRWIPGRGGKLDIIFCSR